MKKFAIPVLLIFAFSPIFAGDSIIRFNYQYGSSEVIPGTGDIGLLPPIEPPITPPTICNEKPRPHDCPKAPDFVDVEDPEHTQRSSFGVGFSKFLNSEDWSLEFAATLPYGNPGTDTLSLSAGVAWYLGTWAYVPLSLGYRGDLDSFAFVVGFGADLPAGEKTVFRVAATEEILTSDHLEDGLAWSVGASIGFRLGGSK